MSKTEYYRTTLRSLADWNNFLLKESRLPGPRANLELVSVVADEGTKAQFEHFLSLTLRDSLPTLSASFWPFAVRWGWDDFSRKGSAVSSKRLESVLLIRDGASAKAWPWPFNASATHICAGF